MSKVLIWDLPTRVFHALLAVGFVISFSIAQFAGEHSTWFPFHMMLGIVLGAMVVLRLIWAFLGTKYARFEASLLSPRAPWEYVKSAFAAVGPRYTGHHPGSSYAIVAMLLLLGVVVTSGLLMSVVSEAAEEIHGVAAYALLAVVVLHILGVIWYSLRHRENISRSIITGFKEGTPEDEICSSRPLVAVAFLAIVTLFSVSLIRNYDESKKETKLPLIGTVIHLGEGEHH